MIKTLALASLALGAAVIGTVPAKASVLFHNYTGNQVVFLMRNQGYTNWQRVVIPAGYQDRVTMPGGVGAVKVMVKTNLSNGWVNTIDYTVRDGADIAIRYNINGSVALFGD